MSPEVDRTSQEVTICHRKLPFVAACWPLLQGVLVMSPKDGFPHVDEWLERLTANAEVATVLGSIPASSDTVESEERQMKQCWNQYKEEQKYKKIALLEDK